MTITPRMRKALRLLYDGPTALELGNTGVGQPTKQRLAKHGLAEYLAPRDGESKWDAPMRITEMGRAALERSSAGTAGTLCAESTPSSPWSPAMGDDRKVTVCDECLQASCWQGILLCDKARDAGPIEKTVSELRALDREHEWYWKPKEPGHG